jgi:hypothetical protein
MGSENVNWIELAKYGIIWRAFIMTMVNLRLS